MNIHANTNSSGHCSDRHGLLHTSSDIYIEEIEEKRIHEFILDNMSEGIFIIQDVEIKYANNAVSELYDNPLDQIIGASAQDFVHPEDQQRLVEIYKRRMSGEFTRARYEFRLIDNTGDLKWVLAESVTITWEGRPAALQYLIDITDRKNYEQELEKAHDIISKSTSVMFIWKGEPGWPVEFVTKNVTNLFGYTAEEFKTGVVSYEGLIHPDDVDHVRNEVRLHSEDSEAYTIKHDPYRIITRNGEIKWIEDKTEIQRDEQGVITHYQGIVQDITERIHAKEERERIIHDLQEALSHIKTLEGLIPICAYCKNIRNDKGYWNRIEEYITEHSDAHFSHSICPSCVEKHHPELSEEINETEQK